MCILGNRRHKTTYRYVIHDYRNKHKNCQRWRFNIDLSVSVTKDVDIVKLQEENDTAKSQIDFLNSVIVDMQRKNETLLCKIEVLEMGVPANEADDYSRYALKLYVHEIYTVSLWNYSIIILKFVPDRSTLDKRMAVPRMFCDICDQFDLHETEDCPRQAQDFSESTEKVPKSSKKQSVERPYCENCESKIHRLYNR